MKQVNTLAKKAGFCFWEEDETWGRPGMICWSTEYDKELQKFAKLVRQETIRELEGKSND